MKKILLIFISLFILALPLTAAAGEGPMNLPKGSNADAVGHNQAGIKDWSKGHFEEALKHFKEAAGIDASSGEIHFNEAICYDKLGQHGTATQHFRTAKKNANGNKKLLESPILNGHLGS